MKQFAAVLCALAVSACANLAPLLEPIDPEAGPAAAAPAPPLSPAATPRDRLLEAERALAAAITAKGFEAALAEAIDPAEGFLVRPGQLLEGAAALEALRAAGDASPMFLQPDRALIAASGEMAVTSGRYVQVLRGRESRLGRYMLVWRRGEDGAWRPLTEVSVFDPPGTIPGPAPELAGADRRRR